MGASLLSFWFPVGQAEASVGYPVDLERFLVGKRCKRQVLYAYSVVFKDEIFLHKS